MSLEAQTKQQQGREKPSCLPSTLSNMSGSPHRVSLGGKALAAVAQLPLVIPITSQSTVESHIYDTWKSLGR